MTIKKFSCETAHISDPSEHSSGTALLVKFWTKRLRSSLFLHHHREHGVSLTSHLMPFAAVITRLRHCLLFIFVVPLMLAADGCQKPFIACCVNVPNQHGTSNFSCRFWFDLICLEKKKTINQTNAGCASFALFFLLWNLFFFFLHFSFINKWILLTQTVC